MSLTMCAKLYKEIKSLNLPKIDQEVAKFWEEEEVFKKSISERDDENRFVFYEGPPSANGMPGIHHVMSRTIKDLFCRFKTMQGYQVKRKGGWDTHGLPVELQVEKKLGIHKDDIGEKISIEEYNKECRQEVLKYKDVWDDLTKKMGYQVDLDNPYITFENDYIESVWNILSKLHQKGFLYKGYTVQPFSPAAGTGLSSHELNMPGCYRSVTDTTITAQFKLKDSDEYVLAWTTTPWTLPSNTALAVGKKIEYTTVKTFNEYTGEPVTVTLATNAVPRYFKEENKVDDISSIHYEAGNKQLPYEVVRTQLGKDLVGKAYEQLLPYAQPEEGKAFIIVDADYVTTEDGTGIVHQAPSFGADDMRTAMKHGIGALTLVNRQGRFTEDMGEFAGRPIKDFYDEDDYKDVDVDIAIKLKQENKAFNVQRYEHNYPHCWRTDKPVLYMPLDSWFIKTTAVKDRMIELNNTINWKPAATGSGRFGNWLENLVDWNLSRSRYWGTPLPIWRTKDGEEEICIGSVQQLNEEIAKAKKAGIETKDFGEDIDLHKPFVDEVVLVSSKGEPMYREADLIDVWFDSGAMPYAQHHWPFENDEEFQHQFPADFIAEGVDQTRGWFFTLHAIATMLMDNVAFKNVVSNGLVLDKDGNKMSKRLGNTVDPFETIQKYGADATRWYIISNSQPWDNLKFDIAGIQETQRKFFGTLFNTYSFFALYANIDGFVYEEEEVPFAERPEIDRWILSDLNSLIQQVEEEYNNYEPTRATRLIQDFVIDNLSNWYVRLCRRRFWKGDYSQDKISAYQTLYTCLQTVAQLMAPVAPFFADFLYKNLNEISNKNEASSVHLSLFPKANESFIDKGLEQRMQLAQDASSLILSLRKREDIRVRQPLSRVLIPVESEQQKEQIERVKELILSEVNVKELEYVTDTDGIVKKSIKPNFAVLGKKLGPKMKDVAKAIGGFNQNDIKEIETKGEYALNLGDETITITKDEVEIATSDLEGWLVANTENITVALDIHISDELKNEGFAREFVNRIQNLRKENDFEVTDRIKVKISGNPELLDAVEENKDLIKNEVLAQQISTNGEKVGSKVEIDDLEAFIDIQKVVL